MTVPAPLGASFLANFQTAWYLTILCTGGLVLVGWGVYQVARTLRAMLREGDTLLFATCVSLLVLVVLFFASMTAMVLVSLGPPVGSG